MASEAMEDPRSFSRSHRERYERFMEDSCCTCFCIGPNSYMAQYVYGLFFLVTSPLAWTIHDYGQDALSELKMNRRMRSATGKQKLQQIQTGSHNCVLCVAILVIAMATFSTGIDSKCANFH